MDRKHVTISDRGRLALLGLAVVAVFGFFLGASAGSGGSSEAVGYVKHLPPPPPSVAEQEARALEKVVSYTDYIAAGTPNKKEVALTFDDGPGPQTPQVLAILNRTKTPATFFTLGNQYSTYTPAAQAAAIGGYTIGNHTWAHPAMNSLSRGDQTAQIDDASSAMVKAGLPPSRLFRPPYGAYDQTTLDVIKKKKMLMILWAVDSEDWRLPGTDVIVQNVLGQVKAGDIVLMHDAGGPRDQTIAALPRIIAGLKQKGLTPVTVPKLLLDDPPPRNQPAAPNLGAG